MRENPSWIIVSQKAAADISTQALIPAVVLTCFSTATVGLRWWSRVRISGLWGVEDVVVTVALICSMAFTGIIGGEYSIEVTTSTNKETKAKLFVTIMKLMFAGSIFYFLAVNLIRCSILFQYHRIFRHIAPFRFCIYAMFVATLGATAWGIFGIVFLCDPIHKYWHGRYPGKCMDAEEHFWSCSLIGIILDCLIWVMPMPMLSGLKFGRRAKIGLLVPFGLGLFVCIVSIMRIVHVHGAAEKGDVSKSGTYAAIWSTAEVNVAIMCSSLLVMKPLLAKIIPNSGKSERTTTFTEDSGIRRMMSISTMEESIAGTEEVPEARCEAWAWSDRDGAVDEDKDDRSE